MVLLTLANEFDSYYLPDKGIVWDVMLEDLTFVGQIAFYPAPGCWQFRVKNYHWIGVVGDKLNLACVVDAFRKSFMGKWHV